MFTIYHEYCKVLAEGIRQCVEERGLPLNDETMVLALAANEMNWKRNNPTGYPYVKHAERWLDDYADGVKFTMWELARQHLEDGGRPETLNLDMTEVLDVSGVDLAMVTARTRG